MVNLLYLYYFKAAAETENLTKAAEALNISQPALSSAISKLEQGLGVLLFRRTKGRISLSEYGKHYYRSVSSAFAILEQGERELRQLQRREDASATIASTLGGLLEPMSSSFLLQNPSLLRVNQFLYTPEQIHAGLRESTLDFAVTPIHIRDAEIEQTKLMEEEVFLVAGRDHRLTGLGEPRMEDLKEEDFLINDSYFDRFIVANCCSEYDFLPRILFYTNESSALRQALEDGMGISFVPASVLYGYWYEYLPNLAILRVSGLRILRMISVAKRRDRIFPPQLQQFYQFALRYYRELGRDTEEYFRRTMPRREEENVRDINFAVPPPERIDVPADSPVRVQVQEAVRRRLTGGQRASSGPSAPAN